MDTQDRGSAHIAPVPERARRLHLSLPKRGVFAEISEDIRNDFQIKLIALSTGAFVGAAGAKIVLDLALHFWGP